MKLLLIDNSNTRTKVGLGDNEKVFPEIESFLTKYIKAEELKALCTKWKPDAVVLGSVVPKAAEIILESLSPLPCHNVTHKSTLPLAIDYPNPEQIGADRLANAVAASHHYGSPSIVVDFGTAVTFDVIGEGSVYLGGVIAPGLASLTDYLANNTALLPQIELTEPSQAIGKSTADAMNAGAVIGYRGLVREIITALKKEIGETPAIVGTGGDAKLIANGMQELHYLEKNITLKGLRLIGLHNMT